MARTRPLEPADPIDVGPLIDSHPAAPVATVVLSTRPAPRMRSGDYRRLARLLGGAERRIADAMPRCPARARTIRRLWTLAERASRSRTHLGLALLTDDSRSRHLWLGHPVTDRVLVGRPLTYEELLEEVWGFGRVAVLHLTAGRARLVVCDSGSVWEPDPPWDLLDAPFPDQDPVSRGRDLVADALPARTPVVLAGDSRLFDAYQSVAPRPTAAVLPGDHTQTSPARLLVLAQRTLRRSLDPTQQSAMVSLALACDRGTAIRGLDAVRSSQVAPSHLLLIEASARGELHTAGHSPVPDRVRHVGGRIVTVPDGYLAHHARAALVPDHARPTRRGPASVAPLRAARAHPIAPVAPTRPGGAPVTLCTPTPEGAL